MELRSVGEQLKAATCVPHVWSIALEVATRELAADAGAWIWSVPEPKVEVGAGSRISDPDAWFKLLSRAESPEMPFSVALSSEGGPASGLFIPITVEGRRGWMALIRSADSYGEEDLAVATWITEMARLAAVGLLERERSEAAHTRQIAALAHVTTEITSTIDLDRVLDVVLEEALGCSGADAGFITLLTDEGGRIYAADGYGEAELAAITVALLDEQACAELSSWLDAEDVLYSPNTPAASLEGVLGPVGSVLVTPIFYEQQQAGSMLLQSTRPDSFSASAIVLIEGLAGQAAIAVGNARRFEEQLRRGEQMRQRAEQMSLLLEVSRTMRSDRPLEDILLDVAYAVQEGTGFDLVLISVLEGNSLRRVAGAGIPLAELAKRKQVRLRWDRVRRLFQDRFKLGQCYYIPEQFRGLTEDLDVFTPEGLDVADEHDLTLWHNEDIFFVPLRGSAGDVIGIVSVDRPRDGLAPTAMTAEVVEIFASQVSQIIENQRLVESLQKQVTTLQLFNEVNRSITTKLDLPLVLNTVVQSVTNLLGYDFSTIFLRDYAQEAFLPMASSGYALEYLADGPSSGEAGFVRDVIRTGMPIVAEDAADDLRFVSIPIPIGSSIVVPLMAEGRSVGVLTADRKKRGEFSAADVATLMALADQVSVAVDNARLFEEVKRFNAELEGRVAERTQELAEALERLRFQRDRSEVLYHIASELVASLDIDRVLSQALLLLQRAVHASRSSVILLNQSTGELFYRAAIGHEEPIPPGGKLAPFDRRTSLVGWALEKRTSLVIPDVRQESRFGPMEAGSARSVMAVPIIGSAGESLGVILFESPLVGDFDETQLRLVEAAAIQLGNALNNAELYRLIREQAERLGAMLRAQQIDAAKNQAILEDIADGVMVADEHGNVILFNAAAEKILSIVRQQSLGRNQTEILELFSTDARAWLSPIEAWRTNPESYMSGAILTRRLTVDRRYVSIHLSPVVSTTKEFLGVVSVFRDITPEIEADRAKTDFVSTVSHELRTPMTAIVGYVDLMLNGAAGEFLGMQLEFLKRVKTNADRLTNLVNDLLDISRIEQGRVELLKRPVSIEEIITQVATDVEATMADKEQTLTTVVPSGLPRVFGDPDRLIQILVNLIGNAYKYTPVGGQVTVYSYVRDAIMYVAVADTGIGIAPENQKRIFERFYRVEDDPAVYEVSGTGLGLAITLSLIQMHAGNIWLESELGRGSIFTFSIPLAEGEPIGDVGELPPPVTTEPAPTILVVEDDSEVSRLLQVTLESEGMRVLRAASGEAGLQMAREKLPDFISLDLRLPDLDGLEVLQLLKRDPETADIPVAIVSVASDRERGRALGALDYFNKPLDEQRLLEVIRRTLRQHDVVLLVGGERESLSQLRSALRTRGVAVRTTTRGERALGMARDLRPAMVVLDLASKSIDGYLLVDRLKRDRRTSSLPVMVTYRPDAALRNEVAELQEKLKEQTGIRFVPRPRSMDELAADIQAVVSGNGADKES